MAKADELKALVARLLPLKESAVTSSFEGAAEGGLTEARINGLRVWFYDSTFPPEMVAQGADPTPTIGIEVRDGNEGEVLLLRVHVQHELFPSGQLKASKWKRGDWEHAISSVTDIEPFEDDPFINDMIDLAMVDEDEAGRLVEEADERGGHDGRLLAAFRQQHCAREAAAARIAIEQGV